MCVAWVGTRAFTEASISCVLLKTSPEPWEKELSSGTSSSFSSFLCLCFPLSSPPLPPPPPTPSPGMDIREEKVESIFFSKEANYKKDAISSFYKKKTCKKKDQNQPQLKCVECKSNLKRMYQEIKKNKKVIIKQKTKQTKPGQA